MLEELFNLVKNTASQPVIENPDVPNEHNNAVVAEATNTVASGFRNMIAGGGVQNLLSLFNNGKTGDLMNNPMVNMMIGHFSGKLMNKYNLGGNEANRVASSLIPDVINNFIAKTNDPNDSHFSIEKLLNSITGGQSAEIVREQHEKGNTGFNFQNLIGQFTGNDSNKSGGGLMDIISRLAGGAQAQQQRNGDGGLMDLINGFLK
jgi:hypothetical protein